MAGYNNNKNNNRTVTKQLFTLDAGWNSKNESTVVKRFKIDAFNGNILLSIVEYDKEAKKFGKAVESFFVRQDSFPVLEKMFRVASNSINDNPDAVFSLTLKNSKGKSFIISRKESRNNKGSYYVNVAIMNTDNKVVSVFVEESGNAFDMNKTIQMPAMSSIKLEQAADIIKGLINYTSVRWDNHLKDYLGGNNNDNQTENKKTTNNDFEDDGEYPFD